MARLWSGWRTFWNGFEQVLKGHPSLATAVYLTLVLTFLATWGGLVWAFNAYSNASTYCEFYRTQVGVEVRRRADLLPVLVAHVGRYAAHERDVMKHIADARASLDASPDIERKAAAAQALQAALTRLLGIVEQYPNLKASVPTQALIKEVSNTENRIAAMKERYNERARDFNNMLTSIPTNWMGWCFGYRKPIPYIDTDEDLVRAYLLRPGGEGGR